MINTKKNHQLTVIVNGINLSPATVELDMEEYNIPYYSLPQVARGIERLGLGIITEPKPYGSQFPSHVQIPIPSEKLDSIRKILEKCGVR